MTQAQRNESGPALVARTELAASQVGERLGRLAGLTGLRIQQAARSLHVPTERGDQSAERQGQAAQTERTAQRQAATARAEEAVDRLGQRISHWALVNGLQARRTLARLREDGEDLWVEAREKRAS